MAKPALAQLKRPAAFLVTFMSLATSFIFGFQGAHPAAMVLAYMGSAVAWLYASLRAEFPPANRPSQSPNLANAIAASLAATGTTAGVDHGWAQVGAWLAGFVN
jgi:hypothetical protein